MGLTAAELEAFVRFRPQYGNAEALSEGGGMAAAAEFVNARRAADALGSGREAERVSVADVARFIDELMARAAEQEDRGRTSVAFAARGGEVNEEAVQRLGGQGYSLSDPWVQQRLSAAATYEGLGRSLNPAGLDGVLTELGVNVTGDGRQRVLGALGALAPGVRGELLARWRQLRREHVARGVGMLLNDASASSPNPTAVSRKILRLHNDRADPRWLALARDPGSEPALVRQLQEDVQAIVDAQVSAGPEARAAAAGAVWEAALARLRGLDPDLMGEVLARLQVWPSTQRRSVLASLVPIDWQGRLQETREDAHGLAQWLRRELATPQVIMAFDHHCMVGGRKLRADASRSPEAVQAAIALLSSNDVKDPEDSRRYNAVLVLADSVFPDPRIDETLRQQVSPKPDPLAMVCWNAEIGLMRRGQVTSCAAVLQELGDKNALAVRFLAEVHAGRGLDRVLSATVFAELKATLQGLARGGSDNVDEFIANALQPSFETPEVRAAFLELARDLELSGPRLDPALRAAG